MYGSGFRNRGGTGIMMRRAVDGAPTNDAEADDTDDPVAFAAVFFAAVVVASDRDVLWAWTAAVDGGHTTSLAGVVGHRRTVMTTVTTSATTSTATSATRMETTVVAICVLSFF